MPRPKGWKPLNYTTLATICGRIISGDRQIDLIREYGIAERSLGMMKRALAATGVRLEFQSNILPDAVDARIQHLIRTTRLTNHEITKMLRLTGSTIVRSRRATYHNDLRAAGLPVPMCECGDEFQHAHECLYWKRRRRGLGPSDADAGAVRRDLLAGYTKGEIMDRNNIGGRLFEHFRDQLTARQLSQRRRNLLSAKVRQGRRQKARQSGEGLFARLSFATASVRDPDIRKEAIQMMAEAILEGSITENEAAKHLRQFVSKAYAQDRESWNSLSLDDDASGYSLKEQLEDESALEAFEWEDA